MKPFQKFPFLNVNWHIFQAGVKVLIKASVKLTAEIVLGIGSLAIALLLAKLGISEVMAIALGLVMTIILCATVYSLFHRSKFKTSRQKSEVKFANWIVKTLFSQASSEWLEYQDWLHDILLARQQLLNRGCPSWKVTLITYWRLGALCTIVTSIKLRNAAIALLRWR
jgi:hypothetical protein